MESTTWTIGGYGVWNFVWLLVIAGVCGALGQAITGVSRGGCLVSIALGFIGALVGLWVAQGLGLPSSSPSTSGNALSHSVVDHRIGPVRRRHQPDFPLSPVRYPPGIGLVDITRGK